MKKISFLLIALLLLAGCGTGSSYSKISNGSDVIFKSADTSYTNDDLYKSLKLTSQTAIENDIINKLADTYNVDLASIEADADSMVNIYIAMGYESMLISYYGSVANYRAGLVTSGIVAALAEEMVKDDFDNYVSTDKPVNIQMMDFDNLDDAQTFVSRVEGGESFDMVALDMNESASPESFIFIDSDTSIDLNVKDYLNSTDTTGLSTIIESTSDTGSTYYVVNVISRNVEEFKDDYLATATLNIAEDEVKNYFFSKHNIQFYDQDLYEIMSSAYEVFK
ncbi:MAG: hypothetical protein Q4D13_06460 [Erysipelotrichaceae bacterium]|nr:hypothetical protein [Erysipelotrichaceae bacterium]